MTRIPFPGFTKVWHSAPYFRQCASAKLLGCRPVRFCITTLQRTVPISKEEILAQQAKLRDALACLFYVLLLFARSRSRLDQEQPKEDR
jgi:hypothetical protein